MLKSLEVFSEFDYIQQIKLGFSSFDNYEDCILKQTP